MQMAGGAENKLTDVLAQPPIPACQGDAQSNIQLCPSNIFCATFNLNSLYGSHCHLLNTRHGWKHYHRAPERKKSYALLGVGGFKLSVPSFKLNSICKHLLWLAVRFALYSQEGISKGPPFPYRWSPFLLCSNWSPADSPNQTKTTSRLFKSSVKESDFYLLGKG